MVLSNKRLPFESPGTASKDVSMYTYVWHIADHFEASYPNGIGHENRSRAISASPWVWVKFYFKVVLKLVKCNLKGARMVA